MFKVGDKVVRKPEYQSHQKFGWPFGSRVLVVTRMADTGHSIYFDGNNTSWDASFFTPAPSETKAYPKAGEFWKQRSGEIVGPLKVHERSGLLYTGNTPTSGANWFSTGVLWSVDEDPRDLVTRVECCPTCGKVK